MKIIFIGAVDFSYWTLKKLLDINADIVGVITKEASAFNSDFSDLSPICVSHDIDWKYVKNVNHEANLQWIKSHNPDIIFCFGWSQILGSELLNIPPLGVIGYHPAKLPFNRGRHPLIWALCLGLDETASTFFIMDEGADTGDIISQLTVKINKKDDAASLYQKLISVSLAQIEAFMPLLESGTLNRKSQDGDVGNSWRKRSEKDGEIDWRMSSENIYNLVRALSRPYIGAHFIHHETKVKVWKVKIVDNKVANVEPGKVLAIINGMPSIKCGEASVLIEEMEPVIKLKSGDYL
jgi:methionyl-tRNA formyltransferase